jgi:Na+-driven multidrug efflux pump
MGLAGAWLGMAADLAVRGIVFLLRFRSGRWKRARV